MLSLIYPILSTILCALIEWVRIKLSFGRVQNVSKFWSVTIALLFFGVCLALSVNYYDNILPWHVFYYGMYFAGCRGLFYDPLLNSFRGLSLTYFSTLTNSRVDRLAANLGGFWALRLISLFTSLIFGYLWQL